MKKKNWLILVLLFIQILVPINCKAVNSNLRNIPLHKKEVYSQIEFLEVKGYIEPILDGAKPITYGDFKKAIEEINLKTLSKGEEKIVNSLLTELNSGTSFNIGTKEINLAGNFILRCPSHLLLETKSDEEPPIINQPHYILYSKLWTQPYSFLFGETGVRLHQGMYQGEKHIPPAYAKVNLGPAYFEVGEDSIRWGPGYFGSLSISGNSRSINSLGSSERFLDNPEMDIFKTKAQLSNFKVTYFTARDAEEWGHFKPPREEEVFLSGLRTDVKLGNYLKIGAGDVVVSYDPFEFGILIKDPLSYFTDICNRPQGKRRENLNLMGTCDLTLTVPNCGRIYGEYIWDSTIGEDSVCKYNAAAAGPKTGLLVGAYFPFEKENKIYEIRLERTVIDDTVYTFPLDKNLAYKYKDRWLGHWAGPDSVSTVLELSVKSINDWDNALRITRIRKGVNLPPEQELLVTTLEAAKDIKEDFKVKACLQRRIGEIKDLTEGIGFSFEFEMKFDFLLPKRNEISENNNG